MRVTGESSQEESMAESPILRQASSDAAIFETFSSHQKLNLLREFHYFTYCSAMYNLPELLNNEDNTERLYKRDEAQVEQ
jgi:hypothetical protein